MLLHRYVYVVEVLMVGCGWSVKRPKELLGLLGGRKAVAEQLKEGGADEAIAKELKRLGLGDAASEKKSASSGRRKKKGR